MYMYMYLQCLMSQMLHVQSVVIMLHNVVSTFWSDDLYLLLCMLSTPYLTSLTGWCGSHWLWNFEELCYDGYWCQPPGGCLCHRYGHHWEEQLEQTVPVQILAHTGTMRINLCERESLACLKYLFCDKIIICGCTYNGDKIYTCTCTCSCVNF